jgi:general secretion pathway protein D
MIRISRTRMLALAFLASIPALALAQQEERPAQAEAQEIQADETQAPSPRDERLIDVLSLIEQVAETEQREFIVDPRVRGRVYIIPSMEAPTYDDLQAILRTLNYAAVATAERVFVVPDALARVLPTRVLLSDDDTVSDDEVVTRVLEIGSENAQQLVPLLRPMLPQQAHLVATPDKLVIVDRYDNVRRIVEVAQALTR